MTEAISKQLLYVGGGLIDAKTHVGRNEYFQSIEELLVSIPSSLEEGLIISDANFSVSWQIYKEGETWKYRLHQGMFYVDAVAINNISGITTKQVSHTVDGSLRGEGAKLLVAGQTDQTENGIWVVHEGVNWERHPIFDDNFDDLVGVTIKIKTGNSYQNSTWRLANYNDIVIGTTVIQFVQIQEFPEMRGIVSGFGPLDSSGVYAYYDLNTFNRYTFIDTTSYPVVIRCHNDLLIGKEYTILKYAVSNIKNPVLVIHISDSGYVTYLGTLINNYDAIRFSPIRTAGGVFGSISDYMIIKNSSLATEADTIFITQEDRILNKREVYIKYNDENIDTHTVTFPHDAYEDFVYIVEATNNETLEVYDYDGNALTTTLYQSIGFFTPGDNKYVTKEVEASANAEMTIKIPAGWKLKDIVVENPTEETYIQATGTITITDTPVADEVFVIGDETFTFKASASAAFEVTIDADNTTQAENIVTAITNDSTYVSASNTLGVVDLEAKVGYLAELGNAIALTESATGVAVSGIGTLEDGETLGNVTINVGTTSEGTDVISSQAILAESLNTISINKILSLTEAKTLYISSSNWHSTTINVYATRDEGISKTL